MIANHFLQITLLMFAFPLNKLRCWGLGEFDSKCFRPFSGVLAAFIKDSQSVVQLDCPNI